MKSYTQFPGLQARFGVARWDITPALNVAVKNWGARTDCFADAVHRPLTGSALAIAQQEDTPLLLISLDLGWWRDHADADNLRLALSQALSLPEQNLIVHLTHTHAGPLLDSKPSPELNPDATISYLAQLKECCEEGAREAISDLRESTMLFHSGSCELATQRDFLDPDNPGRYLTGFNPDGSADKTLLVARVFDEENKSRATLVNYACHPTTLAWENDRVSPDFVGAMREVVEGATDAPCLFLQGASGELAPAEQYVGEPELADRHGQVLGYAAMSLLVALMSGQDALCFDEVVESGAPLACWRAESTTLSHDLSVNMPCVDLPLKQDLPSLEFIQEELKHAEPVFALERLSRQLRLRESLGEGEVSSERIWSWQLGAGALVALPFEAYSIFQQELRKENPYCLVLNISNGSHGYLVPSSLYDGPSLYTVWQTPYAAGSLEKITQLAKETLTLNKDLHAL